MAKQTINVGTTANDKKGDSLRAAFQKVNANFTELYTALGLNTDGTLNLGAFEFVGSTMSTTDSTAITIDQAVTVSSNLTVGGDILPSVANGGNLGSLTQPFKSLYVSNSTVFFGGVPLSLDPVTSELKVNNVPLSQTITFTDIPNAPTDIADLTDSQGLLGGGAANTGDITFAATTISAPNEDEIVIQSKDSNGFGTARFTLNSEYGGDARLRAFSSESVDTFTLANGDFATGVWRDNGFGNGVVEFTGAQGIGDFFQNTLFKLTPDNVSITINSEPAFTWNGGANGSGTDTPGFGTNPIVPVTPITITSIEFRYRSESFISVNYDNQEIRLNVQNGGITFDANNTIQMFGDSNIELQSGSDFSINSGQNINIGTSSSDTISISTGDLNITAFDDVNFRGSDSFRIRNTSASAPIRIITDDNNTSKTWAFNPDGNLTLPGNLQSESDISIDINLSDSTLRRWTFTEGGDLTFPDGTTQTTAFTGSVATGDITFDGVKIQGAGTASGDGNGYSTIELVPDTNLYVNDQYLIIDPTQPSHIHIRAGGTQDSSNAELYLGGENSYFRVGTGSNPSVQIKATDNSVSVSTQGTVVTNNIYTNTTDFVTDIDIGGGIVISGWSQRNESEIEINLFVSAPGDLYTYLTSLGIGSDVVVTYSTVGGNQTFTSTVSQVFAPVAQFDPVTGWQRIAGRILGTLPVDQTGIVSVNFPVTTTPQYDWAFNDSGSLTFPDATVQTTAYPGPITFLNGDVKGSVFGDDSSLLVDGVAGVLRGNVEVAGNWTIKTGASTYTFSYDPMLGGNLEIPGSIQGGLQTGFISSNGLGLQIDGANSPNTVDIGNISSSTVLRLKDGVGAGNIVVQSLGTSLKLQTNNNSTWEFNDTTGLTFPDSTVQTTAYTGPQTTLDGDVTGSVFADNSTLLVDGVNGKIVGDVETARLRTTDSSIVLGITAGETNQGVNTIAIGAAAGQANQGTSSIAIGGQAGNTAQGVSAVALGAQAGATNQGAIAVSLGTQAGSTNQGLGAVAVGTQAGIISQGNYAVALGYLAGANNQPANSIVINASGSGLDGSAAGFYVNPVRNITGTSILQYNATTGEITHFNEISSEEDISIRINLSDSTQRVWRFGEDGILTLPAGGDIVDSTGTSVLGSGGGGSVLEETFESKSSATGVIEHDATTNRLFRHTSISANFTANFTNLGLTAGKATSISLVLVQGATARMCTAVQIGGAAQTITWQGSASAPLGNANRTDVVTFSILCTATDTYTVLGMLTSFGG